MAVRIDLLKRHIGEIFADSCLFDDNFLSFCLQSNGELLQEIIRIFLERQDLTLTAFEVQKSVLSAGGRSLRADAWAVDKNGDLHLFEVHQGGSREEIELKISFQAAILAAKAIVPGIKLEDAQSRRQIPFQHLLFICDGDVLRLRRPYYEIRRVYAGLYNQKNEPLTVNDRLQIRIINGAWQGPDAIGRLIADMHQRDVNKIENLVVRQTELGIKHMTEINMDTEQEDKMLKLIRLVDDESWEKIEAANKRAEEAKIETSRETAKRMKDDGLSIAKIMQYTGLSESVVMAL